MPITDEDVLRELLHRATDDVHAPSAVTAGIVTRHRRRLRSARILSITTTSVAAAAVAATVVVTHTGPSASGHARPPAALPSTKLPATTLPPVTLTAMRVLDQLSVTAGRVPQPTGRYVSMTMSVQGLGVSYERMSVFDGVTGDVWTYQRGSGVPGELPVAKHLSPTRAEFAAWPTNPAKLRTLLLSPAGQALEESQGMARVAGQTPDDLVFQDATYWLWNPLPSPALRSALYKVLAATPGVEVKTGTTDKAGRPAIEISRYDSVVGVDSATFESPSSGAELEQDFSDAGTNLFWSVTGSATLPANPYTG
jgi:hypothetical protein